MTLDEFRDAIGRAMQDGRLITAYDILIEVRDMPALERTPIEEEIFKRTGGNTLTELLACMAVVAAFGNYNFAKLTKHLTKNGDCD